METIIYAAVLLDICAIVLIFSSYLEKRTGEKVWGKVTDEMELADEVNVYDLECDEILIGRHAMADIRIQDMSVSRYHAILNVTDGKWMITDIGSKSGVFVNGEPVRHIRLYEGDVITLGNRSLIFRKRVNRR
ncbi:MAG: FHA domain-containing protein [Ruminococcus sp.]|nr:FHA domain-containing protein [Ruminococcus sp.]